MSAEVKTTAIVAAGYVYQTMQGVNLLCDWLDSPTRYTRVRFECDEDTIAPQGLDDLVAERPDGRIDVWQIKFTPSPDKHSLDWNWLLDKPGKAGGKSRSNLRKWFDAYCAIEPSRVGEIRLLTNRIPDLAMEACLAGSNFIDYTRAPADVRLRVEQELNGAVDAEKFFKALEVRHSDKGFASMQTYVTDRLRRRGTAEGLQALKNRAIQWSIEKNQPAPDGWITLELIKNTLQAVAPEPLPENFIIPVGYRVPDNTFYVSFVASIEAAPRQPIVLTGPPGRGKSTFLSKVCDFLQKKDIPFVRHHYYLSSTDRTLDRHTSFVVQESILGQIDSFHSEVCIRDRTLRAALGTCAAYYEAQGKVFVIVLDGLDHVWRNQGHDKRPLDEVFNSILPTVKNLVIVVGTQPVEDAQLPNRLLAEAARSTWLELPTMSADAVLHYLRKEVAHGRLLMDVKKPNAEQELQAAAAALRARTNGHPLNVIYAAEELIRSGRALSKWNVEQLTGDLGHDAKSYYASLWQLLGASQKDILRLICEFPFFWPESAFADIGGLLRLSAPAIQGVEHLLHRSAAGFKPFHESLIVFVKQTDDYDKRISELTPEVEKWLSTDAPNALRVNWLWAVKAKQGRPQDLINGLQRDWVMQRLQEGYPTELFVDLLAHAEEEAVQRAQYADAYRLRHLETRLRNSVSYQLGRTDAARLKTCTWWLATDTTVIEEAIATRHEASTIDVAALALALEARGDIQTAKKCAEEAFRRHRGESRFTIGSRGSDARDQILQLAKAFSALDVVGSNPGWASEIVERSSPPIARKFLEAKVEKGHLRTLVGIALALSDGEAKLMACDAAVHVAAMAEADLSAWSEFPQLSCGVLIGCSAAIAGKDLDVWTRALDIHWPTASYDERKGALARLAHDWFFGAARLELTVRADRYCLLDAPAFQDRGDVSDYLNHLGRLAREVAKRWVARNRVPFSYIYEAFDGIEVPDYRNYHRGQGASDFRYVLHTIAVDVHLLSPRLGSHPHIEAEEMQRAMNLSWFDAEQFRRWYVSGCVKVLSDDAADVFIRQQLSGLDATVNEETGVRMLAFLELCEMALRHGLHPLAVDLCRRTWEMALGYGQRKDPALSDVMDALEYLYVISPDDVRRLLADVAPQVHNVLSYTDGKGTRHVLAQADSLLAKTHRAALVEKYREHTEVGDWYHAENSLEAYVTTGKTDSAALNALMRTGLHTDAVEALRKASTAGDAPAGRMLAQVEEHIGADVGSIFSSRSDTHAYETKPFSGDVTTYDVTDLSRLLFDLRDYYGARRDALQAWYVYWEAKGKGSELVAALEPRLLSENCRDDDLAHLLDLAFKTKFLLEGASVAFPYIVQAQLYMGGWMGPVFMERREATEARLQLVVERYRQRCDEFFLKSSFTIFAEPKRSRIIPSDIMVFFLGLQGRKKEAVQFVEAMVASVLDDTRTLHLERPRWADVLALTKGEVS